jgi:predicted nucleotidyltransferase
MKLKGLSEQQCAELFSDHFQSPLNMVLGGYRGSIAHGTYVPSTDPHSIDDKDIMGVYIGKKEHYIGFEEREVLERKIDEWDVVLYELRKFVRLLLKSNPNVLMMLWLPEKYYIFKNVYGESLIKNRNLFVSKYAYHSFSGYAYGQFHRMTNFKFEGYMGEKRKALVEKFGYDTKNASHLIRLLKMGIEFLTEGNLHVEREDATQLISIKKGEWTLDQVKREADRLFALAQETYIQSKLPDKPESEKIERLLMQIIEHYFWGWKDDTFKADLL